MKHTEVLTPSFFRPAMEEATKIIKSPPKKGDEDLMLTLVDSEAWKKLKAMIEGKQAAIMANSLKKLASVSDLQEYGFRSSTRDLVLSAYQSVIDSVEIHRKYAESARK